MADTLNAGRHGAIVQIGFSKANATTGLSAADMTCEQDTLVTALHGGSVIGIALHSNADVTAGTLTARAHKAGTEFSQSGYPAPVLDTTNAANSYATVTPGSLTFDAGDTLGISLTTTTTLDPTNSADIDAWLIVHYNPV